MKDQESILEVNGLHIRFGSREASPIVADLSFTLQSGRTLAIVGESGSGKSLTALALMGLLPGGMEMEGDLRLNTGDRSHPLNISGNADIWQEIRGKEMGMVFQEPMSSLNPIMKIGDQLLETISLHQRLPRSAAKKLATDWLAKVQLPSPEKIFNRYPHQLSGGQKQRVMIAMAMCNNPRLLIADEPTTALDVTVQQEIIALMQQLQETTGTAMIFITHDLALASMIADDLLVLFRGKMMEYGKSGDILRQPRNAYTKALLACRPTPAHKGERLPVVSDFIPSEQKEETAPVRREHKDLQPLSTSRKMTEPLLRASKLRIWFTEERNWFGKSLSYFKAVDDVSFDLWPGEILGLVGESGCGKSTLSRSLIGLVPVREGSVIFNGEDLSGLDEKGWRRVRKDIQMIFQDPFASLNPRMTVGDILAEPLRSHRIVNPKEIDREVKRLTALVQLPAGSEKRYPHQFSGGQRQRIGIARALALRPRLLICDESVSALDVSVQAQILNLLKDLQQEFSLSYLFISHNLAVVHYISDRVMVMQSGKIVESGGAEQVLHHPEQAYTRKLIASEPVMKL